MLHEKFDWPPSNLNQHSYHCSVSIISASLPTPHSGTQQYVRPVKSSAPIKLLTVSDGASLQQHLPSWLNSSVIDCLGVLCIGLLPAPLLSITSQHDGPQQVSAAAQQFAFLSCFVAMTVNSPLLPLCRLLFSVSLASLIADTERLLASSTLARDIDVDEPTRPHYPSTNTSSPDRIHRAPSPSPTSPTVQVHIRPQSPSPNRAPTSSVSLFSPSSDFDRSTASIARSHTTSATTTGRSARRSFDVSSSSAGEDQRAGADVDIRVEYDEDDPAGGPRVDIRAHSPMMDERGRVGSPSLRVSISPSHPPASSDIVSSASVSGSFSHINKLLLHNGFAPVPVPSPSSSRNSLPASPSPGTLLTLLSTFADVLHEYAKRGQLIHELMTREKGEEERVLLDRQQQRIDELLAERVTQQLEQEKVREEHKRRLRDKQHEIDALKAKCAQLQQSVQQKESVVQTLQAEVADVSRARRTTTTTDGQQRSPTAMFRRLHGRPPADGSETDSAMMRVIRMYEERGDEQRAEIEFLRREVAEANAILQRRREEERQEEERTEQDKSSRVDELRVLRSEKRQRDAEQTQQEERLQARAREAETTAKEKARES